MLGVGGIGVGAFEGGADDVEEVAVGPVVFFDQGPEGDDVGVEVGVEPGLRVGSGEGAAESIPFGRISELFRGGGEVAEPGEERVGVEVGEVALGVAESGEVTGLGVGVESGGGEVPVAVDALVDDGFEPVAPAEDGAVGEEFALGGRSNFQLRIFNVRV